VARGAPERGVVALLEGVLLKDATVANAELHHLLHDAVGVQRLLFGTNLPFIVPQSPIMELGDARLPDEEDAAVRWGNARAALGDE
jgi:predicted TIM-barrel fold metal-dependent hydrolase